MHCGEISDLPTPGLLIDINRLKMNIEKMAIKASENGVALRPHVKTHKCIEIARLQREYGSGGITVSTLDEALIFADAGFNDITYAVPISSNKIDTAFKIGERVHLNLLLDSMRAIELLAKKSKERDIISDVLLKIDCGYHRCGVDPNSYTSIKLVHKIVESSHLRFRGILTHAGHSYSAESIEQGKRIAKQEQQAMVDFVIKLNNEGRELKPEIVSIGSTPTISVTDSFMEGITEIRPGNYVFYDYTQVTLQSCRIEDCALTLLSRVIGRYDDHIVIDAGATALSKDLGPYDCEGEREFGKIYSDYETNTIDTSLRIDSLSQEHGKVISRIPLPFGSIELDSMLRILPNHSCLTANLHDVYYIIDDLNIINQWKVQRHRPITSACL